MHNPTELVAVGVVLVVGGLLFARHSYGISRFSEQLDAIGSRTRLEDVEPAGWKVWLNRTIGYAAALCGLAFLVLAVLD